MIVYQLMMLPGSELATKETRRTHGMTMRYRVLPRCFGNYPVAGKDVLGVEIEEVCIATNTLSFQDYLDCRFVHLLISIFYNDAVFGGMLKLIKAVGGSFFRWIEILGETAPTEALSKLFDEFKEMTQSELWEDRVELERFVAEPGVIDRYISGELGYNLILTYKSLGMTLLADDVADLAHRSTEALLNELGADSDENLQLLADIITFDTRRMSNIWETDSAAVTSVFNFDVERFLNEKDVLPVCKYRLNSPTTYRFVHDDVQRNVIDRNLEIFGNDIAGITRILSKVYTKKLLRKPIRGAA